MKDFFIDLYNWVIIVVICYVSGWLMFLQPLINLFSYDAVSGEIVVGAILKIIFALPIARLIYLLGMKVALIVLKISN